MSLAGSGFAEAYVMRKLHKEKMKRIEMEMERADQREVIADDGKVSEVYMMRELQKEKIKRREKEGADEEEVSTAVEGKVSAGCFSMMFKKIHPTAVPSSADFTVKEARTCDQRRVA
ncbi:hypothetical protein F0562_027394 [Nyssa sinensis]|uniref:Uncharacterized protein n=1 Tax=Nyssa sinensis TaxID=561372 RepID=A0A5J5B6V1_9ASTE|nr:hypothetical protein F0562_027394 [Nyssa sinensis]